MKLIGLDYDGTLVTNWTSTPLPGVREHIQQHQAAGTHLAVVTNQGGPAWRASTKQATFPTVGMVANNLIGGLHACGLLVPTLYVAIHPGKALPRADLAKIDLAEIANELFEALRAGYEWGWLSVSPQEEDRKPNPGMLLQMYAERLDSSIDLSETCYVGDMETDKQTAQAARIPFVWATDWHAGALD